MKKKIEKAPAEVHWTEAQDYLNADGFQDRVKARNARCCPELFPGVAPSDIPLFPEYEPDPQEALEDEMSSLIVGIKDRYRGDSYGLLVNALIRIWTSVEGAVIEEDQLADSLADAFDWDDDEKTVPLIRALMVRLDPAEFEHPPLASLPVRTDWDQTFVHETTQDGFRVAITEGGMLYLFDEEDQQWSPVALHSCCGYTWLPQFLAEARALGEARDA